MFCQMNREEQHLEAAPRRKRRRFWWKIPLGVLLVLVLILVVAWTQISAIALWAANRALPGVLGTEASVKFIEVEPLAGLAVARGLRIAQPRGFGDGTLLELDGLKLSLDIGTISGGKRIVIRNIEMQGLRVHLVRNAHGAMNVMNLGPPRVAHLTSTPAEEHADSVGGEERDPETSEPFRGILIEQLTIRRGDSTNNHSVLVYEHAGKDQEESLVFKLTDLDARMEHLLLFPEQEPSASPVLIDAVLDQGAHPPARLGIRARCGAIRAGVPALNVQGVLTGLLLESFGAHIPPHSREAIGGAGMDIHVAMSMHSQAMELGARAVTDRGLQYPLRVGGRWGEIETSLGPFAFLAGGRLVGGAVNLARDSAEAVRTVARGATGGVRDLKDGAEDAREGMVEGLLKTSGSILKGDPKKSPENLHHTVKHTAKQVSEAARRAGRTAAHTATEAVGQLTSAGIDPAWTEAIAERHRDAMNEARADLAGMPFPPSVLVLPDVNKPMRRGARPQPVRDRFRFR